MADSSRRSAQGPQVLPLRTAFLAVFLAWGLQGLGSPPAQAPKAPGSERLSASQLRSQLGGARPVPVALTVPERKGFRPGAEQGRAVPTSAAPASTSFKGATSR